MSRAKYILSSYSGILTRQFDLQEQDLAIFRDVDPSLVVV